MVMSLGSISTGSKRFHLNTCSALCVFRGCSFRNTYSFLRYIFAYGEHRGAMVVILWQNWAGDSLGAEARKNLVIVSIGKRKSVREFILSCFPYPLSLCIVAMDLFLQPFISHFSFQILYTRCPHRQRMVAIFIISRRGIYCSKDAKKYDLSLHSTLPFRKPWLKSMEMNRKQEGMDVIKYGKAFPARFPFLHCRSSLQCFSFALRIIVDCRPGAPCCRQWKELASASGWQL